MASKLFITSVDLSAEFLLDPNTTTRFFHDPFLVTESSAVTFDKIASDQFSFSDEILTTLQFNRALTDSLTVADTPFLSFDKATADQFSFSDTPSLSYAKASTDQFAFLDEAILSIGFIRSFSDAFTLDDSATVDSIASDQFSFSDEFLTTLQFNRALSDAQSLADIFSRTVQYSRGLTDTVSMSENFNILVFDPPAPLNGTTLNFATLN